jgi:hypothetical protein
MIAVGCDRFEGCQGETEVPQARSQADCEPLDLGQAADVATRDDLPVDRVVTLEIMPHPSFFGWVQDGQKRSVSKLLGTERRILLAQDFEGEAPSTTTKVTGLLRRWSDLPANPWEGVRNGIKTRFLWDVPQDAYVVLEGVSPLGCDGSDRSAGE